jgi:dolichol-phosphate mannosyltransferase
MGNENWIVPEHEMSLYASKASDYALVIPVINEGERIRAQLSRVFLAKVNVDVIVADGGSTDGSLETEFLKSVGVRALITKTGPGRLSAQLRAAYAWCLDEGYLGIVTIDGNGKDNVEAVGQFVEKLEDGFDYVQGSRYLPGGAAENTPFERTIGNRFIHAPIMSISGRNHFTDTTNGYRGYSARYLLDSRVAPFREIFMNYELLFYLTARAGQLGYQVCEIPVKRSYPAGQPVPTKINGLGAKLGVLRELFGAAFGRYAP